MKRFYGKHLNKYTGDLQPACTLGETGIAGRYAPLAMTGFKTDSNWRKKSTPAGGLSKT